MQAQNYKKFIYYTFFNYYYLQLFSVNGYHIIKRRSVIFTVCVVFRTNCRFSSLVSLPLQRN